MPTEHDLLADELIRAVAILAEAFAARSEGLILTKMIAFRPQDQADIETLLIANRAEIDVALIRHEWSAVGQGEETRTAWLEEAIARLVPSGG
jgi:hypothetical protein